MKDRRIWIPHMDDSAYILSGALRGKGYDAQPLPRSPDLGFSLGRKFTDGDQCLPSIVTTEDILYRVNNKDFKPQKEAFFQGKSEGPCRFGRYYMNQQLILEKIGLRDVPIVTMNNKHGYSDLGSDFFLYAVNGSIGYGMLQRMLHFTRPFEINKGETEKVYKECVHELEKRIEEGVSEKGSIIKIVMGKHNRIVTEVLNECREKFKEIPVRNDNKPKIFVTGEFYVRSNEIANQNLIRKIENLGGVALLEPSSSFFTYVIGINSIKRKTGNPHTSFKSNLGYKIKNFLINFDTGNIEKIFPELPHDPNPITAIELGSRYMHPSCSVETLLTLGGADYFASRGIDGIINAIPHNCMPGVMVVAHSRKLRNKHHNIPFLNLSYDGHVDPCRDDQLEVFIHQILSKRKNLKT